MIEAIIPLICTAALLGLAGITVYIWRWIAEQLDQDERQSGRHE